MRALVLTFLSLSTLLDAQATPHSRKPKVAPKAAKVTVGATKPETKPLEPLHAPVITSQWTVPGFSNPESALWDAKGKVWYVSNMAGGSGNLEGKGFIAKLDSNGLITAKDWVKGLNAPKGLGLVGRTLYIADIDALVAVDVDKGAVIAKYVVAGAKFLNGIAASPEGDVYVSDTTGNAVFVLRKGAKATETLVRGPRMDGPNGLLTRDGKLLMVGWGVITNATTFETSAKGSLHRIDLKTLAITTISKEPLGNLDGIEAFGNAFLVTDYAAGKLFIVDDNGQFQLVKGDLQNPADLGVDPARHMVAVPEPGAGQVTFLVLN